MRYTGISSSLVPSALSPDTTIDRLANSIACETRFTKREVEIAILTAVNAIYDANDDFSCSVESES